MAKWLRFEAEVLARVVADVQLLSNTVRLALGTAFPYPEHPFAQDVLVALNVPRQVLGLEPYRKPGDVDLLIVPVRNGVLVDRTIAIEAKVVRPTISKPSRNANSMGRQQTLGLLEDGFPFVGLIHMAVPESLSVDLHSRIPLKSWELGENGELKDTGEVMLLDPFPLASARRQEGRLQTLGLPPAAAYKSIGFGLSQDGEALHGCTTCEQRYGEKNPRTSRDLLDRISLLVERERERFRHVRWFDEGGR